MSLKRMLAVLVAVFTLAGTVSAGQDIPKSQRSRQAIYRTEPGLCQKFSKMGLDYGAPVYMRIFKKEKELQVWIKKGKNFTLFKTYRVCTYGFGSLGPKTRQGDGQAPEGFYYVRPGQLNPASDYYLSFNLGYPNKYDRAHKRTGSALMVHGKCVSIGCYAMTNKRIEEIYTLADAAFRNGQPFFRVHIFPFKMNQKNMNKYKRSKWISFWENLKQGHDFFKKYGNIPPNVEVAGKRYVFDMP